MSDLLTVTHHLLLDESGTSFNIPVNHIKEHSLLDLPLKYFVAINETTVDKLESFINHSEYIENVVRINHSYFLITSSLVKGKKAELVAFFNKETKGSRFYPLLK